MVILILIIVQCLQNVVFGFEKGLNSQNYSLPDSHRPIKKFLHRKICIFLKLGFTPGIAEQPLQGIDLQEKEAQKN